MTVCFVCVLYVDERYSNTQCIYCDMYNIIDCIVYDWIHSSNYSMKNHP